MFRNRIISDSKKAYVGEAYSYMYRSTMAGAKDILYSVIPGTLLDSGSRLDKSIAFIPFSMPHLQTSSIKRLLAKPMRLYISSSSTMRRRENIAAITGTGALGYKSIPLIGTPFSYAKNSIQPWYVERGKLAIPRALKKSHKSAYPSSVMSLDIIQEKSGSRCVRDISLRTVLRKRDATVS